MNPCGELLLLWWVPRFWGENGVLRPPFKTLCPLANIQPRESILEQFREALDEKMAAARLFLRTQEMYEEREMLLRRYLSQEDIEQFVSEQHPIKDAASVGAKFLRAICEHNLRSLSLSPCLVSPNWWVTVSPLTIT